MGCIFVVLPILLQELSGRVCFGQFTTAWVRIDRHFTRHVIANSLVLIHRYSVGPPGYQDAVQKEFVFKLSFKNHIYFFRAESEHTYNRWLEVLRSTTQSQDFKNMSN